MRFLKNFKSRLAALFAAKLCFAGRLRIKKIAALPLSLYRSGGVAASVQETTPEKQAFPQIERQAAEKLSPYCVSFYYVKITAVCLIAVLLCVGCGSEKTIALQEQIEISKSETININTATREELARIPYVGESTAALIIEFRAAHGAFKRPEQLMQIRGVSDERFRRIRHLIRTE